VVAPGGQRRKGKREAIRSCPKEPEGPTEIAKHVRKRERILLGRLGIASDRKEEKSGRKKARLGKKGGPKRVQSPDTRRLEGASPSWEGDPAQPKKKT